MEDIDNRRQADLHGYDDKSCDASDSIICTGFGDSFASGICFGSGAGFGDGFGGGSGSYDGSGDGSGDGSEGFKKTRG
jgi:hypothetical protein